MNPPRKIAALVVATALALAAVPTVADPRPGAPLPGLSATDLTGRRRHTSELTRGRTLVVLCTSSDARAATTAWVDAAASRHRGRRVRVVTLVALSLSALVPEDMVLDRARAETSRSRWSETWIETRGGIQRALGVSDDSAVPWAVVLDERGHVLTSVHGPVNGPGAQRVWSSLGAPAMATSAR